MRLLVCEKSKTTSGESLPNSLLFPLMWVGIIKHQKHTWKFSLATSEHKIFKTWRRGKLWRSVYYQRTRGDCTWADREFSFGRKVIHFFPRFLEWSVFNKTIFWVTKEVAKEGHLNLRGMWAWHSELVLVTEACKATTLEVVCLVWRGGDNKVLVTLHPPHHQGC